MHFVITFNHNQTDGASLVAEICGTKRQLSVKDENEKEEGETKKLKKEEEQLVMTGLSDVQIKERMGEVVGEPKDEDLGQVCDCYYKIHQQTCANNVVPG